MFLKTILAWPLIQQALYTNVAVREEDSLEARRQKRKIKNATNNWIGNLERRIEALLLTNFGPDDWYCALRFDDAHLPPTREKVSRRFGSYIAKLKSRGYHQIKYFRVIEHRHGVGRWHIHCIISGAPKDALRSAWIYGQDLSIRPFDPMRVVSHKDSSGLARYLSKELPDKPGHRTYSTSQGANKLAQPVITRQRVPDTYTLTVPDGCSIVQGAMLAVNPFGSSSYVSYWLRGAGGIALGTPVD